MKNSKCLYFIFEASQASSPKSFCCSFNADFIQMEMGVMKAIDIAQSIALGFLFGIVAVGLLPFLVIFSLNEIYGKPESNIRAGISPFYIFVNRANKKAAEGEYKTG